MSRDDVRSGMNAFAAALTRAGATRDRPVPVLLQRGGGKDCGAKRYGDVDAEAVSASLHNFADLRVQAFRESDSPGPEGVEVGPMGHPLEREADRAAEQVARPFPQGA